MNKAVLEIYQNIVNAKIGEPISTKVNGHYWGQSVEDVLRDQGYKPKQDYDTIFDWKSCDTRIIKLAEIKPYKAPVHDIKTGDIFYNMWGWEQTNVDFYQVVSTTAKTITIRRIMASNTEYDPYQMSGKKKAVPGCFHGEETLKKTPYFSMGEWRVNFEYGSGAKWDGEPMDFTCYA